MQLKERKNMAVAIEEGVSTGLYEAFKDYSDELEILDGENDLKHIISIISASVLKSIEEQFKLEG